jgi:hypothetical protein
LDTSSAPLEVVGTVPAHCLPILNGSIENFTNLIWCHRLYQADTLGLSVSKVAKIHRLVCKMFARIEATNIIQRNIVKWLDAPQTRDGRLGIRLRLLMREDCGYGNWSRDNKDPEMWSLYPPESL